jgi:hypothetical protein
MGVDTKLYVNSRWQLEDIVHIIKSKYGEVTIKSNHDFSIGYFNLFFGKRMMHVFCNTATPLGAATLLSLGCDDEAHEILKSIAERIGGAFIDNDVDDKCELINGNMWEENALPYFLKYAIVHDGIDPDDTNALVKSRADWQARIDEHNKGNGVL